MEQNKYTKHINVRISDVQLDRLMATVDQEKTTLSTLIRNLINGYNHRYLESLKKGKKSKGDK